MSLPPKLFEAVPNFSEGRDKKKIDAIVDSVRSVRGVCILDLHSDPDHNRSVLTLVGEEDVILDACHTLARACMHFIDLSVQEGEHPKIGVLDVLPFVPLEGATMKDAVRLAHRAGEWLGSINFPVYLYEQAATAPHRRNLANIRRGGYDGLNARIHDPSWEPDYGPGELDPRRGAVAVGARPFLVAFNAYLDTNDVELARAVAGEVRERSGGLQGVKALGLLVKGRAQVSMNLTDLETTPIPVALEAVRRSAHKRGARVESTELVGLVPLSAVLETARYYLALPELGPGYVLETALWGEVGSFEDNPKAR
jgi:glutamate formiminotransferase